jgi:putative FmdB family regulatory protein
MPTYDYRCTKCKHRFELFHGISDDSPKQCPRCKGRSIRIPTGGAGLLFRGSGFYITDYRSKSYREKARSEKSTEASGGSGGSGKSAGPAKSAGEGGSAGGGKTGGARSTPES